MARQDSKEMLGVCVSGQANEEVNGDEKEEEEGNMKRGWKTGHKVGRSMFGTKPTWPMSPFCHPTVCLWTLSQVWNGLVYHLSPFDGKLRKSELKPSAILRANDRKARCVSLQCFGRLAAVYGVYAWTMPCISFLPSFLLSATLNLVQVILVTTII